MLLEARSVAGVSESFDITVVIPTFNAGSLLKEVLCSVENQETSLRFEVVAIDSGSTDETIDILRAHDVRIIQIPQATFNHGATRNDAALRHCETPLVAFLSQDATPAGNHWLRDLARTMEDPTIVGCFATQRPRPNTHPFQRINAARHHTLETADTISLPLTVAEFQGLAPASRLKRLAFDNVSSLVRRSVLCEHPFPNCDFGEDMRWAREVLLSGGALAKSGTAQVLHSHGVNTLEFRDRPRRTHRLWRELTDYAPYPHLGWWLRRTLGQMLRLTWAALSDASSSWPRRLVMAATAPCWGWIQMRANRRGSAEGCYDAPRAFE